MFHPEHYCHAKFRSPCGPALLNASWTQLGVLGFTSALQLSPWRGVRCRRWRAGEGLRPTRRPPTPYAPEENPGCPPASEDQLFIGGQAERARRLPHWGRLTGWSRSLNLENDFTFSITGLCQKSITPGAASGRGADGKALGGKRGL